MKGRRARVLVLLVLLAGVAIGDGVAENTDPANDDSRYAYAENVGWINAKPNGDGGNGVQVDDHELSGWMWGENVGWISLSCINTETCATESYGVTNDACGNLSGYAWAENVGWINFSPVTAGVIIDPRTGDFGGDAWAENIGWISFASTGLVPYGVNTAWRRYPPTGGAEIELTKNLADLVIDWDAVVDADGYDVLQGSLTDLRTSGGDFSSSTSDCLAEDQLATSYPRSLAVGTAADFFLVRAVNCGGIGTCDSGGSAQSGDRDAGIAASGTCQ